MLDNPTREGVHLVAMNKKSVIIIDDFSADPDRLRDKALCESYRNIGNVGQYSRLLGTPRLIDRISRIAGLNFVPATHLGTGRFNYRTAKEKAAIDIHVDLGGWNGILFLNKPEQCRGGTSLWRHKETRLESWPRPGTRAALKRELGVTSLWDYFVNQEGLKRSRWDLTMDIPMKYNRLVLFRGDLFHSPSYGFGDRIDNARLIQVFFFKVSKTARPGS